MELYREFLWEVENLYKQKGVLKLEFKKFIAIPFLSFIKL